MLADGWMDQADLLVVIAADAVGAALEGKALAGLAWNEELQPFTDLGLGRGEPLAQPVN